MVDYFRVRYEHPTLGWSPYSSSVAAFQATVGLTTGIATFGQVIPKGQLQSGDYLKVGSLTTQTDVKTTWDDGSVRFAIVTCDVPLTANYEVKISSSQATSITPPSIPDNTYVSITISGVEYRAACPNSHNLSNKWMHGPLCIDSRHEVTPVLASDGVTEHPFLNTIWDVRSFASGNKFDITVENVLDTAGAQLVTYDLDIVINGSSVFSQLGVEHRYLARWKKSFDVGYTKSQADIDFDKAHEAGALPKFLSSVVNPTYSQADAKYGILREGDVTQDMSSPGGSSYVAYYPNWCAQYMVHKDSTQYAHVLKMGDLAASWPVHVRKLPTEPTETGIGDLRLVSIDQESKYWLDTRAAVGDKPAGDWSVIPSFGNLAPDNAHQPSLAYIPYLMTGDRFYSDEMSFWGIFDLIHVEADSRGSAGILWPINQPRGVAWALRNMTDAASYLPDGVVKTHLAAKVQNNLNSFDSTASGRTWALPLHFVNWSQYTNSGKAVYSAWQNNFIIWAIDHAHKQGFTSGQTMLSELLDNLLNYWNLDNSVWPETHVVQDYPRVTDSFVAPGPDTTDYYSTYPEIFLSTYGDVPSGSPGSPPPIKGYYGLDHRVGYMVGIEKNKTGAQGAYDYLSPQVITEIYINGVSDAALRSGWAIDTL